MATYAIGDVQGCFAELMLLLEEINFNAERDTLWFAGDLVNRGPASLEVLRFIYQLGDRHSVVLGNHDLHLLARALKVGRKYSDDTLDQILIAPDCADLIEWLRHQPLLHYDANLQTILVHAGVASMWTLPVAVACAREVESVLQSESAEQFLAKIYVHTVRLWSDNLRGQERLNCITDYLTRMRFCYGDGSLDLESKGECTEPTVGLVPWFQLPLSLPAQLQIVFGHWAALGGVTNTANCHAIDTGCVWGGQLTALRLDDMQRFQVAAID